MNSQSFCCLKIFNGGHAIFQQYSTENVCYFYYYYFVKRKQYLNIRVRVVVDYVVILSVQSLTMLTSVSVVNDYAEPVSTYSKQQLCWHRVSIFTKIKKLRWNQFMYMLLFIWGPGRDFCLKTRCGKSRDTDLLL